MRTLITGGEGQLGRSLLGRFRPRGETDAPDVDRLDVADRAAVAAFVERFRPDVIVHAAAWTDVDGCERDPQRAFLVNEIGASIAAAEAARVGAKLVLVSTDFVFGGESERAYTEEDEPRPISVYGASKLAGERAAAKAAPGSLIARTAWLYGEGGTGNFVRSILGAAGSGRPLRVVDDQFGSPTYTEDLADSILALVLAGASGLCHVVNAGETSRFRFARRILDLSGRAEVPIEPIPTAASDRPAPRPARSTLRSVRLERWGVTPLRSWEQALVEYLERIGERRPGRV